MTVNIHWRPDGVPSLGANPPGAVTTQVLAPPSALTTTIHYSWLGSSMAVYRYVMYFRLVDDVTFSHNDRDRRFKKDVYSKSFTSPGVSTY